MAIHQLLSSSKPPHLKALFGYSSSQGDLTLQSPVHSKVSHVGKSDSAWDFNADIAMGISAGSRLSTNSKLDCPQ